MPTPTTSVESGKTYVYPDMVRQNILRMIPPDGLVIGSIGCGYATTESVLASQGREVHGVDLSAQAIEVAKTRLASARVVAPDEGMPFERESLDGLILADVIEHLPMAWNRLSLFAEMVKPGGWVVISVPNMRYCEALGTLICGEWPEHPTGIFDETHLQVMTHRRLLRWCEGAGLRLDRWFDAYHYSFYKRNICRVVNLASFRLLRGFMVFQVMGRFRRI
ncbi:MAG: methyltransferase domain-containing protein [Paludisphaera borealis]|uniref:class I SAM-dependent methyltransferase n=1 Tax=Paludisphaera borealis TaxID=1387353 RepID=UPI00284B9733|nr:methyltransferase domain-containing protein [Paludisphaera borealis]MDR3620747.1 methyltransferase domain-containing protein [Paludisphaera borealis]